MTSVFENKSVFGYTKLEDNNVNISKKAKDSTIKKIISSSSERGCMPMLSSAEQDKINELMQFIYEVTEEYFMDFNMIDKESMNDVSINFINNTWDRFPEFLKSHYEFDKNELIKRTKNNHDDSIAVLIWRMYQFLKSDLDNSNVKKHNILIWGSTGGGKTSLLKILGAVFNPFNPNDEAFKDMKVSDHETGTLEVGGKIVVTFGNMILTMRDVPGTNDADKIRSENKIMKEIKETKDETDALFYTMDISDPRQQSQASDKWTLENLAYGFKEEGVNLWKKVIVVFTKANDFNITKPQKPVYDEDNKSEEYDKKFIKSYERWIERYNEELDKRIEVVKRKFKSNFVDLFSRRDLYNETSPEEIERIFSEIQFVVAGFVIKETEYEDDNNEFQKCKVLPLPNFDVVKDCGDLSEKKTLNSKIKSKEYVKVKNWVNDVMNAILICSSNDFKLRCCYANTTFSQNKEKQQKENRNAKKEARVDDGIDIDSETRRHIGKAAIQNMKKMDESKKGLLGYLVSTTGGGVIGGAVGGLTVLSGGAALPIIGILAGIGAICGVSIYHAA